MRRSGLILSRKFVIGILIWTALLIPLEALRGSAVVLHAKTKAAEQKEADNENAPAANVTKPQLTGIPQIDYVLDPNLPRELNGHNLTDYPFYNSVPDPDEIDFKCDGLHDGFYASVAHKCQVYHHCLFGTRFDFLCANYTAFDQKTFICHFVSEVDCDNSPKYFKRNEDLYKEATTTTTTTTTTPAPSTTTTNASPAGNGGSRHGNGPRRRRPYRRRRPMYEYYYDDEEYADSDYYDDEVSSLSHRRPPYRKHNKENYPAEARDPDADYDSPNEQVKPSAVRPSTSGSSASSSVYERPRAPPKIRRPVPKSERDKYDYSPKQVSSTTVSTTTTEKQPANAKAKQPTDEEYYEDEEEYEYEEPKAAAKPKHHVDYDFPTGFEETRRHISRFRSRMPSRKRAEMYDDYDTKERPSRVNRRKEYTRYDNERPRNARPMHRQKSPRHEEEQTHKPTPMASHKKRPESEYRMGTGRRAQETKRPATDDDYYYDEEEEPEEAPPKRNRRPTQKANEKVKSTSKQSPQSKERVAEEYERPAEPVKYGKGPTSTQRNPKANTLENEVPKVSPTYNEISTTEINWRATSNQKHPNTVKAVKIVNNSLKDEGDENGDTYAHTEAETRMSSTQMKPISETPPPPKYSGVVSLKALNPHHRQPEYAPEFSRKDKKPFDLDDRPVNKTVTPVRHFVASSPRKPSHYAPVSPPVSNHRDDLLPYRGEEKPHKLPEPVQKPAIQTEYYKPMQYAPQNVSLYSGVNYRPYSIAVPNEPKHNVRPVKEEHLVPETLNAITNNNYFSTGFISEPKPFTNDNSKSTSANTHQNYRQEHRLYGNGDRLYTTNSISFPPHPPANYDITAPGPSAPGEEPTAPEKKYSEPPTYTASADYDVTYNDALQPSTLHPVRRYPSTSFYSHNQQQRSIAPSRVPSDYAFNESAFNSLSRSQTRYK